MENRRRHNRFSATAFLNKPVYLNPLPPYFGHALKGKLIDLSAGGMAILIDEIIPPKANLSLVAIFPDGFKIQCFVQIRHAIPRNGKFLHGIEFLNLPHPDKQLIERMSNEYINCENRLQENSQEVCHTDCAFHSMCRKAEKINPVLQILQPDGVLELAFQSLDNSPFAKELSL